MNYKKSKNFLFVLTLFVCSCSTLVHKDPNGIKENAAETLTKPFVVMISLDGFRHDYIKKYKPPFLSSIKEMGIQAQALNPIFPSKTFPNHYSLITGLYAENHGLVANRFYDPQRKEHYQIGKSSTTRDGSWYGGSPLWESVRAQGMLSASFFWVGSDANINNHYPNYYVPYDHGLPNKKRVAQILKWLELPETKRPHFLTLYFSDVDSAGHRHGPDSDQVRKAVHLVDGHISQLVSKTKELGLPINFVIVSDHGMKSIDPQKRIYLKKYIDTDLVDFQERGPISLGYVKDQKNINDLYQKLKKAPHLKVYKREELPNRFHFKGTPRAGDLILIAEPGAYIYPNKEPLKEILDKVSAGGTHGYDPLVCPEMGGIFLSFGPGVKGRGVIPSLENIHIYPYVMGLLDLDVKKKIDGKKKVLSRYLK